MSFHDIRFPTAISLGSSGGPERKTEIVVLGSGFGHSWDQADVPLAEDSEAYEIDILDSGTVVRTLASSSPSVTYTLAQQMADFGAQQWSVTVVVYQLSAVFGRGAARSATLFY